MSRLTGLGDVDQCEGFINDVGNHRPLNTCRKIASTRKLSSAGRSYQLRLRDLHNSGALQYPWVDVAFREAHDAKSANKSAIQYCTSQRDFASILATPARSTVLQTLALHCRGKA